MKLDQKAKKTANKITLMAIGAITIIFAAAVGILATTDWINRTFNNDMLTMTFLLMSVATIMASVIWIGIYIMEKKYG